MFDLEGFCKKDIATFEVPPLPEGYRFRIRRKGFGVELSIERVWEVEHRSRVFYISDIVISEVVENNTVRGVRKVAKRLAKLVRVAVRKDKIRQEMLEFFGLEK